MNGLDTQFVVLNAATSTVQFAVNWFVQSTLLITIGMLIGWGLRRRGSAAQSIVYRTTLAAVLLCPLATWSLSQAGVTGWSVTVPDAWAYEVGETAYAAVDPVPVSASPQPTTSTHALAAQPPVFNETEVRDGQPPGDQKTIAADAMVDSKASPVVVDAVIDDVVSATPAVVERRAVVAGRSTIVSDRHRGDREIAFRGRAIARRLNRWQLP